MGLGILAGTLSKKNSSLTNLNCMNGLLLLIAFFFVLELGLIYFGLRTYKILVPFALILLVFVPTIIININPFAQLPEKQPKVALILGAGILNNSSPSAILQKRLDLSLEYYNQKKIKAFIVSGDNSSSNYNEPQVMKNYLVSKGVPSNRIFEDFGGVRTADSCYRAKNFFHVNEVFLITQEFHIPRAKFLCDSQGLRSEPLSADSSRLYTEIWGNFREVFANWSAIKDSVSFQPKFKSDGQEADFSKILQE